MSEFRSCPACRARARTCATGSARSTGVRWKRMDLRPCGVLEQKMHDGPAQLISLALLRLDGPTTQGTGQSMPSCHRRGLRKIHSALCRMPPPRSGNMSAGLILPELDASFRPPMPCGSSQAQPRAPHRNDGEMRCFPASASLSSPLETCSCRLNPGGFEQWLSGHGGGVGPKAVVGGLSRRTAHGNH